MVLLMIILWFFIGFLNLVVLFMILGFLLLQRVLFSKFEVLDRMRRKLMDKRAGKTNEIINGVKKIKFNALENVYKENIDEIRKEEKSLLSRMFKIYTLTGSYSLIMSSIVSLIVFSVLKTIMKKDISVGKLFAILMLLARFASLLDYLILALTDYYSALPSFSRFNKFMRLEERKAVLKDQRGGNFRGTVSFSNYTGTWSDFRTSRQVKNLNISETKESLRVRGEITDTTKKGVEPNVLFDFDFEVNAQEFVGVIGKVGSGKTSLIRAICGDLKAVEGAVKSYGKIALVAQQAFLVNDTLKNNILFGMEYQERKYAEVIRMCQLEEDLKILKSGDQTEIGERGINLSGGQKQRVSLARAVYSDSDIYLIDDCLSALDAHVGKKILQEVLLGYLKRMKKTVIMITHHTHFLPAFDRVMLLDSGKINLMGRYSEVKHTAEFKSFVISLEEENHQIDHEDGKLQNKVIEKEQRVSEDQEIDNRSQNSEAITINQGRLTVEETRFIGIVGTQVMGFFIKKGNSALFMVTIIAFTLATYLSVSIDWWAGKWFNNDFSLTDIEFIWIYFGLVVALGIFLIAKSFLFSSFAPSASYNIYKKLLWNLLRKPMSFFDTNPSGVIINRAVDDMETVDLEFSKRMFHFLDLMFIVLASYVLLILSSLLFCFVAILMITIYFVVFYRYLRASIELKRIFRIARSPVLTTLSEMVNGATQIRVYGYRDMLKRKWEMNQAVSTRAEVHEKFCFAWVSIWINLSFAFISMALGLSIAIRKNSG